MKFLIQKVKHANVVVDGADVANIEKGFLVFVGITHSDTKEIADALIKKMINLRIFEDNAGKMNFSLADVSGSLLIVSQFTLYANTEKGNRPSFFEAARPEIAEPIYDYIVDECTKQIPTTKHGIFGADMKITLLNDGPTTIILEK